MPGRRTITTMCPMNCHPTQCGMTVEVEGNKLLTIKGDVHHPESHGFLCVRGRATREILDNPQRLLTPLRRIGQRGENRWEACSWDEAYTMIVEAIEQTRRDRVGIWRGHGVGTTGVSSPLLSRFGEIAGFQTWSAAIVCWALGGYGLALTGVLEANTKEDMAANARTIFLWGSTFASHPGTAPHLIEARKRGAYVVQIDTRRTEASKQADEVVLLRPGSDAALALAMAHVIVQEGWVDHTFIDTYAVGYEAFAEHVQQCTPEWGAEKTGIDAARIRHLARIYATQAPAMILLGASSMYKHQYGWEASRAVACLPALTGQLGIAGGGMGPRHGAMSHSDGFANILADVERPEGTYIPSHMTSIAAALNAGKLDVLFLLGTNMLSSFADGNATAEGLAQVKLIVAYDIFMNETIRRTVDLVLPGTVWLEEVGLKQTATHFYLMEQALSPAGETRSLSTVLCELAERLAIPDVFPWQDQEDYINALIAPQRTNDGHTLKVQDLREMGGYWQRSALSHVAYPERSFHTPSKKIEFWSERAQSVGLSPMPSYTDPESETAAYPLRFCQGRTLTAFHAFYDEGQALPTLAKANKWPELWIHPLDAHRRDIQHESPVLIANERGQFEARARVTEDILQGTVWMRDGWSGINQVTNGALVLSLEATDAIPGVPGGQAAYDAWVEVRKL